MMRKTILQYKRGKWYRDFEIEDREDFDELLRINGFRTEPVLVIGENTSQDLEVFPRADGNQFPALVILGKLEEFVVADLPSLIQILPGLAAAAMSQEIQALTETLERYVAATMTRRRPRVA